MNNKGQTTIFFTMMISILCLFTLTALELGRIYMGNVKIKACVHSMRSSIMADYNAELFERYHLLFFDPTYGTGSEAVAEEKMTDYLEYSLNGEKGTPIYQFNLEEIAIADKENILSDDMKLLKQQIADYEQTAGLIRQVQKLADEWNGKTSDLEDALQETDLNGTVIETSDDADKKNNGGIEEGTTENTDVQDPREQLQKILKLGLLTFVLPNQDISSKQYDFSEAPSKKYQEISKEERNNKFDDIHFLKLFLNESTQDTEVNGLLEHAAFASYVTSHFSNILSKKENCTMQCEVEYILAGEDNDYDNLEAVVNEMIWMRMPVNYAYLLKDVEKKSEALTVATAICIATGTEPIVEIVKYLLLGCWAYGESLYEMQVLLSGENIAFVKTKENWYTDLETLAAVNQVEKQENGLSYEDFLVIMLAKKGNSSLNNGYARILDVIQLNLQREYPSFRISDCVGSMTMQGKLSINSMFQEARDKSVYDYYFEESFCYE